MWSSRWFLIASVGLVMAVVLAACGGPSQPAALRDGRDVYGDACSSCHGNRGQGGVGPALSDVLDTWPSCSDHQRWIALGSERWKQEVGDRYGARDKLISGAMPAHEDRLSDTQIASVAAWERVQYGGAEVDATLAECGLSTP